MNFIIFRLLMVLTILNFLTACHSPGYAVRKAYNKTTIRQKRLVGATPAYAPEYEAICTLSDTLKPMSIVKCCFLSLLSNNRLQKNAATLVLKQIQQVANRLNAGDFQFVVNPFEVYIFWKNRLQNLILGQQYFYYPLGITEHTAPETVLAITGYQEKYTRSQSYGYLLGYTDDAVDFFTIPANGGNDGYFTYAIPKDYTSNTNLKFIIDQNNKFQIRIMPLIHK